MSYPGRPALSSRPQASPTILPWQSPDDVVNLRRLPTQHALPRRPAATIVRALSFFSFSTLSFLQPHVQHKRFPGHDAAPLLDTLDLILDLHGDSLTKPENDTR